MDKYRLVQEHKGTSTTTNSIKQEGGAPDDGDGGDSSSTQQQQSQQQQQQQQQKGDSTTTTTTSTTTSTTTTNTNMSCEVRITQQGKPRNYITYSMKLFADKSDKIVLKAMGRAINKAVTIAEILKRKMPLHQCNALTSVQMIDIYEPLEEGLETVTSRRYVSCMSITLSRTLEGLLEGGMDVNDIGYQPPLPIEEMNPGDFHPLREAALIVSS